MRVMAVTHQHLPKIAAISARLFTGADGGRRHREESPDRGSTPGLIRLGRGAVHHEAMHAILIIMGVGWLIFWAGWLIAAFTAKSSRGGWGRFAAGRLAVAVLLIFLFRNWHLGGRHDLAGPVLTVTGLVVWLAGLGLAVWARLYIGRNWGMPMTRREHPDLVTTGPYRYIRHPIYSGIILAMIGTVLASVWAALVVVALVAGFFVFSATREERFLATEFPDAFPAYKAHSKMLIPFIF